jgi:hypothetical protein
VELPVLESTRNLRWKSWPRAAFDGEAACEAAQIDVKGSEIQVAVKMFVPMLGILAALTNWIREKIAGKRQSSGKMNTRMDATYQG